MKNSFFLRSVLISGLATLTACGSSSTNGGLSSNFATPGSSGFFAVDEGTAVSDRVSPDGVNGYAYRLRYRESDLDLVAESGLLTTTDPGGRVITGGVSYSGAWEAVYARDFERIQGEGVSALVPNEADLDGGNITLFADFQNGELTGRSGNLRVNGTISGTVISGEVEYRNTGGDLTGLIGDERAVGAFHGTGPDLIYTGGIYATPE